MKNIELDVRTPKHILQEASAWKGLESILASLIEKYDVNTDLALEFGVEYGYSTIALANYFKQVVGVDTFDGDQHSGWKQEYGRAYKNCKPYKNIELVTANYKDFIKTDEAYYDLIHIDIVHTYEDTYACGKWAIEHAPIVIFHDTESFPDVRRAVEDLSDGKAHNYPHHHGLGIIHSL